jgi:hypothetical protein
MSSSSIRGVGGGQRDVSGQGEAQVSSMPPASAVRVRRRQGAATRRLADYTTAASLAACLDLMSGALPWTWRVLLSRSVSSTES